MNTNAHLTRAMLVVCTRNASKCTRAVHDFLFHRGANVIAETSTKHGPFFTLNIHFEVTEADLLAIGATYEAELQAMPGTKPQLITSDEQDSYGDGFLAVIDCYALDRPGLVSRLTEAVHDNADVYQFVCYRTEAAMQGTPLFVAQMKLHVPGVSQRERLERKLDQLASDGIDVRMSFREVGMLEAKTPLAGATSKSRHRAA